MQTFESSNDSSKYFNESELPSVASKYYTASEERTMRRRTCRFLEEACRVLKLSRIAASTSMVFFHRFYACHSFKDHDRFEVALGCILLASKTEESPRRLTSVIQECYKLKHTSSSSRKNQSAEPSSSTNTAASTISNGYLDVKGQEFARIKERTLLLERIILHTIGFDLSIHHPYKDLYTTIPLLVSQSQIEYIQPSKTNATGSSNTISDGINICSRELLQSAMNFANDSMHTSLCLQYPPRIIALVCIYMSGVYCQMRPTKHSSWIQLLQSLPFDDTTLGSEEENQIDMYKCANIAIQIMELISDKKDLNKDKFKAVETDLEALKKEYLTTGGGRTDSTGNSAAVDGDTRHKRPRMAM
jgi:hypothetical protein